MSSGKLSLFYNSAAWKRTRQIRLEMDNYLCQCEACKKSGDIVVADVVHHIEFLTEENLERCGLDLNNLMSINRLHHEILHGRCTKDEEDDYYFDEAGQLVPKRKDDKDEE